MKQLGPTDLKRLHRDWGKRTTGRISLLLDGVSSPFNVGTIVRTAAALRVEHLYLAGGATSPASAKAGKTAMGTERFLSWSAFDRGPMPRMLPGRTASASSASSSPTMLSPFSSCR